MDNTISASDESQKLNNISNTADNETLLSFSTSPEATGLMSDELQTVMTMAIFVVIQGTILIPGVVLNFINVVTFVKIGLKDTVTISFFALSISDVGCVLTAMYSWLCYIFYRVDLGWHVDMFGMMYLGVWYYQMLYDVSMLITTYTAVQKCCCVAMPLKFKTTFTASKTYVIIIVIWIFCIFCYAPVLITQGLQEIYVGATNSTLLVPWFSSNRDEIIAANDVIARVVLQNATQVIVIACLVILDSSLRKQSEFRSGFTPPVLNNEVKDVQSIKEAIDLSSKSEQQPAGQSNDAKPKAKNKNSRSEKVPSKELQVIKSVTLVSTMFVLCNLPKIILSFARTAVPEMDTFRRYHNLHFTTQCIRRVIEVASASANFFIYYKFNRRFRDAMMAIFGCSEK